jgi:hypothetical protein
MEEKVLKVNQGEDAVLHKEITKDGLEVIQKIPKIQIEILVYSTKENVKRMNKMLVELQKQLDSSRRAKNRVRVFYAIDNGDTTPEQKKQWLIERTYCVYYVFAPENHEISSTYVKSLLDNVKKFEEAIKFFKKMGITISKKKQEIGIETDKTQE